MNKKITERAVGTVAGFARWAARLGRSSDRGMTTSEYAVGTTVI